MERLEIAAGLRLWLGRSGPVEDALYAVRDRFTVDVDMQ